MGQELNSAAVEAPQVSIVMPVYNRAFMLKEVLGGLVGQTYPRLEIVVVDDGSTDDSFETITHIRSRHPQISAVRQENRGPAAARNRGLENAGGDIVHFIDSDVLAPPDLVETHVRAHRKSPGRIIQGQVVRILALADAYRIPFSLRHYSRSFFDTANVSVKRSYLEAVGGFDEINFRKGYEDLDLGIRLMKRGIRVKRLFNRGYAWHYEGKLHPTNIRDFFKDRYNEGRAAVAFYRKHPGFSTRMMTMTGSFFFLLDRLFFNEAYLQSDSFYRKLTALWQGNRKNAAVSKLRTSGYHFYLKGIRDKMAEDGGLLKKTTDASGRP